jgi:histidinol-phosphate aminotransferase
MSKYWNDRTKNIVPYTPGEQPKDKKFIKLNTNENPYPPSPKVIEAIKEAANGDLRLYPDPESTVFREAAAKRYKVKPGQVFAGNGSDEILAFAFAAFFAPGKDAKPVLFPDITYSFYPVYADLWNIPYKKIPLKEDFSIDCEDYKTPCGGAVFPNPNAPTGMRVYAHDIYSVAKCLEEQGRVLVLDEAYAAFGVEKDVGTNLYGVDEAYRAQYYRDLPPSVESVVGGIDKNPNLLTVHTMSKQMSLAGLRFGYAVGSEELIEGLYRIKNSFNSYPIDRLALAGAAAAVGDTDYYEDIIRKVQKTRERTKNELIKMGFTVLPSAANFIFVKAPKLSGEEFFTRLRKKGILVRWFNKERISDYLRVSIGTDDDMDKFLKACKEII